MMAMLRKSISEVLRKQFPRAQGTRGFFGPLYKPQAGFVQRSIPQRALPRLLTRQRFGIIDKDAI
jgi:hypothetical protein